MTTLRTLTLAALLMATCSGCVGALLTPALIFNGISTGVQTYQGREQRLATDRLTAAVEALEREVARLRERITDRITPADQP